MDLVYGSSSSFYMDCEVKIVCELPIRLYRVHLTQCSCIDAFVVDLVIPGCAFYGSTYLRIVHEPNPEF